MKYLIASMAVMALVTYIIRALPLSVFKKEIKSVYVRSLLKYIPYAVLSAMTVPAIISSTRSPVSASVGMAAAVITAYLGGGLLVTALCAAAAVFIAEFFV